MGDFFGENNKWDSKRVKTKKNNLRDDQHSVYRLQNPDNLAIWLSGKPSASL